MGDVEESFSTDDLVALLADAGEVDAGVEVLEAMRASDPGSTTAIRLQARLFAVEVVAPNRRREVLTRLRDGRVDALARQGALLEACVALRLLNREFPEEPMWSEKLSRLEDLLEPLPNAHGDARRAHVDALIAMGKTREAWELLREMVTDSPMELELARRADALRGLLFEAVHTRPYREGDVALPRPAQEEGPETVFARAQEDVARGDLRAALDRVALRSAPAADAVRWGRYRDALTELVGIIDAGEGLGASTQDDETARIGMTEVVDLKIRAGALPEARDDARRQLAAHPDATEANILVRRIAALDEVLGDMARAPTAPAPAPVPVVASVEVEIVRDSPVVPAMPVMPEAPRLEPSDEDMTQRRSSLPTPGAAAPGSIEVKRRKIVRLG